MKRLDIDDFDKKYTPVSEPKSFYMDNDSQIGMYETFGPDLEIVKSFDEKFVWTAVDSEDGESLEIHPGFKHCPIYYMVTNEEWHNKDEIYTMKFSADTPEPKVREKQTEIVIVTVFTSTYIDKIYPFANQDEAETFFMQRAYDMYSDLPPMLDIDDVRKYIGSPKFMDQCHDYIIAIDYLYIKY